MKKVFVVLFVLIAIFAFASCKQDPKNAEPTKDQDPDELAPITQPGVLDVRPASSETEWSTESNWKQNGKFQFKLDVSFNANESIDLYLKCSESFDRVAIRQAGGENTKFLIGGKDYVPLEDIPKNEEGWYVVSVPAESVTPKNGTDIVEEWSGLGITLYVPNETIAWEVPCYVAIRGLRLNGEYFDITEWEEVEDCVQSYYDSPAEFDITLTLDE